MSTTKKTKTGLISSRVLFRLFTLAAILLSWTDASALTSKQCEEEASTDYEKIYCQILAKGKSQALPAFFDFKRNTPAIQRTLLISPARQLGIVLPAHGNAQQRIQQKKTSADAVDDGREGNATSSTEIDREEANENTSDAEFEAEFEAESDTGLSDCLLENEQITCAHARYFLAVNVPNQRLDARALTDENQLHFRVRKDEESVLQYLSNIYPEYIHKMLFLGLGDSTLSFTKFHAIYEGALTQGEDFVKRFEKMYSLLKSERQTMHIKMRYQDNYAQSITQCMRVGDEIIVCDNIVQNWVYRKMKE